LPKETDFLTIGAGIMGLTLAHTLRQKYPRASITIIEKEAHAGEHASGRNSGVLHAGFYYSAESLKAKFCRDGNIAMKEYAKARGLRLNECGKVVVAKHEADRAMLHELKRRGDANGVETAIIDEKRLAEIEPNAKSFKEALYSPNTAVVDPAEVCMALAAHLREQQVEILYAHPYRQRLEGNKVRAGSMDINAGKIINCAGLYADKIARDFGFAGDYTIIPFKGIYLNWSGRTQPVRRCIYSVPNLKNPFLGVHFGMRVDGVARLGPTAIPAFWRENYHGFSNFSAEEFAAIAGWEMKLFATDAFGFRSMAASEMKKYWRPHMLALAGKLVKNIDMKNFAQWGRPGIRAQLLDKRNLKLVQDFTVEGDQYTTHILNANSPAFTSSFPFAKWVVEKYV
jgi:(S)-2-hydroxyglutarate dehydrogenase